ncbi:MAG: hypothetical protein HUU32_20675 [Calditrichaceae bacterium]|nr:hypothetical protein [Calditrichia bacterium]NUQ43814.1 hypothetical protein [Calditrichaceae bacterium]
MLNVFADLFNKIAEVAAENPLLALMLWAALIAGAVAIITFVWNVISRYYLAWLAASAQSIPFAIMVVLLANFALANGENYQPWWVTITCLAFFVLPIIINNCMRQIHTGASDSSKWTIIFLGVAGLGLWAYALSQVFPDFSGFSSMPGASGASGASGGSGGRP